MLKRKNRSDRLIPIVVQGENSHEKNEYLSHITIVVEIGIETNNQKIEYRSKLKIDKYLIIFKLNSEN